jgi:hypothetical protein
MLDLKEKKFIKYSVSHIDPSRLSMRYKNPIGKQLRTFKNSPRPLRNAMIFKKDTMPNPRSF